MCTTQSQRPLHKDDAILVSRRQRQQKPRDHLHRLAFGFGNASRIVRQSLDALSLQISAGLSVSAARSPSESGTIPPATSICLIKEVAESGRPETIVIVDLSD